MQEEKKEAQDYESNPKIDRTLKVEIRDFLGEVVDHLNALELLNDILSDNVADPEEYSKVELARNATLSQARKRVQDFSLYMEHTTTEQ